MNCTKSDGEIGKFLSQKSVGEPGKIGRTAKIGPILAFHVNKGLGCEYIQSLFILMEWTV